MKLENLTKIKQTSNKRLGRGIGSGRGKTSGRGTKGQKARGKVPASFTGSGFPLYKILPFKRGLGNKKVSAKPILLRTEKLNIFKANTLINLEKLITEKVILEKDAKKLGVKILAGGKISHALSIELPVSKKAKEIIEQVGGKVVT